MNVVTRGSTSSECSSGCESGWTLYLEQSTSSFGRNNNANNNNKVKTKGGYFYEEHSGYFNEDCKNNNNNNNNVEEEEEEDLSMVSDASSGPPHFDHDIDQDEEVEVFCYGGRKQRSMKLSTHHHQCLKAAQDSTLNGTASSPIFTSKKSNGDKKVSSLKRMIDYSSQGFSTNHFHQGRSTNFQEHYGFIQPPLSAKQYRQNQWS